MNSSIKVAAYGDSILVFAVEGLGSMNNTPAMCEYLQNWPHKSGKEVCIDLKSCSSMDSTFMGSLLLMHEDMTEAGGQLCVTNVSARNKSKLKELGILEFIQVNSDIYLPEMTYEHLPGKESTREKMELILAAHEKLVAKNKKNEKKFNLFITELRKNFPKK